MVEKGDLASWLGLGMSNISFWLFFFFNSDKTKLKGKSRSWVPVVDAIQRFQQPLQNARFVSQSGLGVACFLREQRMPFPGCTREI